MPTPAQRPQKQVRVLAGIYELPPTFQVEVVVDQPGFKKLKYVNDETRCSGVWLFNVLGSRTLHERYVAQSIDHALTQSLTGRGETLGRTETTLPFDHRTARAVRYAFIDGGTAFESGFVEHYDDEQQLSVVALSDCLQGMLDTDQRMLTSALASQRSSSASNPPSTPSP